MKKSEQTRKADGWIITHSLHVGDKEVVFGEDKENAETPYMCGFCESNEILRSYSDCIGGDDYLEIMQLYIERITGQIEAVKEEIAHTPVSVEPITAEQCCPKACAPIELWNDTFHRWVNKGARGIALIDDGGDWPRLRYVFDVSDTNSRNNAPFRLWEPKSEYAEQIVAELINHFGEIGVETNVFPEQIMGVVINAVSDNYADYAEALLNACEGSGLADMDDGEISAILHIQLMTSVSYTTLTRPGIDPKQYFKEDSFSELSLFNTPATIAQLGAATADISEMVIRQIERSVRSIERQERDTLASVSSLPRYCRTICSKFRGNGLALRPK